VSPERILARLLWFAGMVGFVLAAVAYGDGSGAGVLINGAVGVLCMVAARITAGRSS
jgi:hypothetical protein